MKIKKVTRLKRKHWVRKEIRKKKQDKINRGKAHRFILIKKMFNPNFNIIHFLNNNLSMILILILYSELIHYN
jgi:hypothetical protein